MDPNAAASITDVFQNVGAHGAWAIVCGAAGGTLNFVRNLDHVSEKNKAKGWAYLGVVLGEGGVSWLATWLRDAFLGAGGALVMLGVISQVTKFPCDDASKLIGVSTTLLVAGFIGRSVLIVAGEKLRRDLNEQKANTQAASNAAQEASNAAQEALAEASDQRILSIAVAQLTSGQVAYMPALISELTAIVNKRPKDRPTAILLGRSYRKSGRLPEAIQAMTRFLEATKDEADVIYVKKHRPDAAYNRACYRSMLGTASAIRDAFSDLELALEDLDGENKMLAASEVDFLNLALHDLPAFERLVGPVTGELKAQIDKKTSAATAGMKAAVAAEPITR